MNATIASKILASAEKAIEDGMNVYTTTCTRCTKITPRVWKSWGVAGKPFMKLSTDGDLMMIEGKRYVRLTTNGGEMLLVNVRFA